MTRKDFKLIANILRQIPDTKLRFEVAKYAVQELRQTNANFDREKFIDACI